MLILRFFHIKIRRVALNLSPYPYILELFIIGLDNYLALSDKPEQNIHNFSIQLSIFGMLQLTQNLFSWQVRTINTGLIHGIKGVGHGDNPCLQRYFLP